MIIFVLYLEHIHVTNYNKGNLISVKIVCVLITDATARYEGLHCSESNLLSMLGRARGNNMKCPKTLWGWAETSFGYAIRISKVVLKFHFVNTGECSTV